MSKDISKGISENISENISMSRRKLLIGSAALAALAATPALSAGSISMAGSSRLQTWLRRFDGDFDGDFDSDSDGDSDVHVANGPLELVVRGPFSGMALSDQPRLKVSAIYRSLPDRPFELSTGPVHRQQAGVVLHLAPGALAGLHLSLADAGSACGLNCRLDGLADARPQPGRYAMLINSGRRRLGPDWSLLSLGPDGVEANAGAGPMAWKDWSYLSLNVRAS